MKKVLEHIVVAISVFIVCVLGVAVIAVGMSLAFKLAAILLGALS